MILQILRAFGFQSIYFYAQAIIKYSTEFSCLSVDDTGNYSLSHLKLSEGNSSSVSKGTLSVQRQLSSLE